MDRPVFVRESMNKSYSVSAFFLAKNLNELIFTFIYPTITLVIIYFGTDLNKNSVDNFLLFCNF